MKKIQYLIIILFLALASTSVAGELLRGPVTGISDGGVFKIQVREKEFIVALAGVVCPGGDLPSGEAVRKFIARQIEGKNVTVLSRGMDPSGRIVGEVLLPGGRNLNEELVRTGRCAGL